ncbi:recombinase family protein [Edaphobacter aggregans]|uniref:recombinase family protein n=1 Tax=Edaphobacter aggregans TaxID=570835 RepID=UPI0009FEAEBD
MRNPRQSGTSKGHSREGFWPGTKAQSGRLQVAIYARVSTHDQQTLPLQIKAMREYALRRGWKIVAEVREIGSGAVQRPRREGLLAAVRRRELDAIIVWRLDRWGRSLADLILTLKELTELGIGFVSLTEAFDMTTPTGRALAGMLAVFAEFEREILSERVKAGIAQARSKGKTLGRPASVANKAAAVRSLYRNDKLTKSEIARNLGISRTSVRRFLQMSR